MKSHLNLKWRLGALTFIVLAGVFVALNERIEYFFDATGLSGKAPIEEIIAAPKAQVKGSLAVVPDGMRLQTNPVPPWNRLYSALATTPLTIDGKLDDWTLNTGRFLCNNCITERNSHSAWMHAMFDDESLYLFSRVRQPEGLKNGTKVNESLKGATFFQCRLQTDQATAINVWRNKDGDGVMQLHYYLPSQFPRPATPNDENLFTAEDAIYRIDGLARGAKMSIIEHPDKMGADIECAIPWDLICIDVSARPKPDTYIRMAYAAQFKPGVGTHVVQLETDRRRRFYHTFFGTKAPAWPPQIEVSISNIQPGTSPEEELEQRLFLTKVDTESHRMRVNWEEPVRPDSLNTSELLVTPRPTEVIIDGSDDEWPKTAEILIADKLSQEDGAAKLKASADDDNLYIHSQIFDITPEGHASFLILKLQTDTIKEIKIEQNSLSVDGADALRDGGKVGSIIAPLHFDYSLEAAIPWIRLTADGKKPASFAITGYASLNPNWSTPRLAGDVQVRDNQGKTEGWVSAQLVDTVPEQPGPIVFANRTVYELRAGIPEKPSYFNGLAFRFPLGTWNPSLEVLPGSPSIDGRDGDWDLSGGIFLCRDLHLYHDNNAVWIHTMYDSENMYILYRFIDSTPMSNASPERYIHNDMAELRIMSGSQMITWAMAALEGGGGIHSAVFLGNSSENNVDMAATIKTAFSLNEDGNGYVVEAALPWATLGGQRVAGDSEPIYFTARTNDRQFLSDPTKYSSAVFVPEMPKLYGVANFRTKGPIPPPRCHLANGKTVPVVMRNGKPELDLSNLK